MSAATRATIKSYFNAGDTPSESNFADFIDTSIDGVPITYTVKTVAASGGDYTTIAAALSGNTGTESARIRILVKPGTYTENTIVLKQYIDVIGAGSEVVTLQGAGGTGAPVIGSIAPDCVLAGMTILSPTGDYYCVHADTAGIGTFTLRDCVITQANTSTDALGCGGRPKQTLRVENVQIVGSIGIHGIAINRVLNQPWAMELVDVQCPTLNLRDFLEYERNYVRLSGSNIGTINYNIDASYYTANPSDVLYNRGWQQESLFVVDDGTNKIGRATITSNAVRTKPYILPSITERLNNSSGSTILAGYATAKQSDDSVVVWAGSGVFAGVVVADISASAYGVVQHSGEPLVFANGSTAIVYGDALELNSSGQWIKRSTGTIRAYARAALASGTGLIAAVLV